MSDSPDDALLNFQTIYRENPSIVHQRGRITEADTRANILDRIVHEVLGWPRDSVRREPHANPGFVDYVLDLGRPTVVLEAKAQGVSFALPFAKQTRRRLRLDGTLLTDKETRDAIEQAQRYSSNLGIQYAVVSNGYTFIIFRAICVGTPWKESDAIVFHHVKDIQGSFTEFLNLLSYEAIASGHLDVALRPYSTPTRGYHRPIADIIDGDSTYTRNTLNMVLRPYVERFFGDIAAQDSIELLQYCYVRSKPIQVIDEGLKIVLNDTIPHFASHATDVACPHFGSAISASVQLSAKGALFVIMGGIGAGKSTFCKRFFRVVEPRLIDACGPALLLELNLLNAPDEPRSLTNYIWKLLASAIRQARPDLINRTTLEALFVKDLNVIRQIYARPDSNVESKIDDELHKLVGDDANFGGAALEYFSNNGRIPIVIIDNVDQLGLDKHPHILTFAERIANEQRCVVVLALREESYSAAQMRKQLTAHQIRPYHLSSPRFAELIAQRIDFAANEASLAAKRQTASNKEKEYGEIVELFRLLRKSLFGSNKRIVKLIESVAYGNMRLGLQLFNGFLISGATDFPKILKIYATHGHYTVPFHEFAKGVILGEWRYYKEERSPIANVFNVSPTRNASHFTTLRLLARLSIVGDPRHANESFVPLGAAIGDIADVFDNEEDCKEVISRCIGLPYQLAELDTRRTDTLAGAGKLRITTSGAYYLQVLTKTFSYLDLVWHDVPFAGRALADALVKRADFTAMETRFERVEIFLEYLESQEQSELATEGLPKYCGPFVPAIRRVYEKEKQIIHEKLRKYARQ